MCRRRRGLLPFDRTGIARIVEFGSRLADDQDKLSARFSEIADLIREANYWANERGKHGCEGEHVQRAVDEKIFRITGLRNV